MCRCAAAPPPELVRTADAASGQPPLHVAARGGCVEALRALAAAGAELEAKDAHGRTALLVGWGQTLRRASISAQVGPTLAAGELREGHVSNMRAGGQTGGVGAAGALGAARRRGYVRRDSTSCVRGASKR